MALSIHIGGADMRFSVVASALLVCIGGCATTQKFSEIMNSYVGGSEANLVGRLGPPNSSYVLNDGSRVVQYTRSANMQLGGNVVNQPVTTTSTATAYGNRIGTVNAYGTSTTYVPVQQPTYNVPLSCTVNFTIDAGGTVRSWNANGNHCVAR